MTDAEKLSQLKALLQITDTTQDATLAVYLSFAKSEILSWLYSGKTPDDVTDVPARYEPTQVMACVAGFGLQGLENQTASTENAITRQFKYSNMLEFIRANVVPYAQVM
jgi:hypothetical protein